jgi:hypothetical protein
MRHSVMQIPLVESHQQSPREINCVAFRIFQYGEMNSQFHEAQIIRFGQSCHIET